MHSENVGRDVSRVKGESDPATLTAGFWVQNGGSRSIGLPFSFDLDKVSITIRLPSRRSESEHAKRVWRRIDDRIWYSVTRKFGAGPVYEYHVEYGGCIDIQFGMRGRAGAGKVTNEMRAAGIPAVGDVSADGLRIEFNPSKVDLSLLDPLIKAIPANRWRNAKVTRCDWAADYSFKVNPCMFAMAGASAFKVYGQDRVRSKRKDGEPSGVVVVESSEGVPFRTFGNSIVETHYIGAGSSPRQLRIYDKARERMNALRGASPEDINAALVDWRDVWWRVEMQDRRGWKLFGEDPPCPFEGVSHFDMPTGGHWSLLNPDLLIRGGITGVRGEVSKVAGKSTWQRHYAAHLTPSGLALPTASESASLWGSFRLWISNLIDASLDAAGKL